MLSYWQHEQSRSTICAFCTGVVKRNKWQLWLIAALLTFLWFLICCSGFIGLQMTLEKMSPNRCVLTRMQIYTNAPSHCVVIYQFCLTVVGRQRGPHGGGDFLSWWCQFIARGLSSPPSPVPKGSPGLEWNKSTTEEAVLGLAPFCC